MEWKLMDNEKPEYGLLVEIQDDRLIKENNPYGLGLCIMKRHRNFGFDFFDVMVMIDGQYYSTPEIKPDKWREYKVK